MCRHFCLGGIILIVVLTIAFAVAIFIGVQHKIEKHFHKQSIRNERDYGDGGNNLNITTIGSAGVVKKCEQFYNGGGESENNLTVQNNANDFPLVVQLKYRNSKDNQIHYACSGVVITSNYILTLAQCLIDTQARELIGVAIPRSHQKHKIIDIFMFGEFNGYNKLDIIKDDIGIIQIDKSIQLSNQFCVNRIKDRGEYLSNIWNGDSVQLTKCNNLSKLSNRICTDRISGFTLGQPLIEYNNGIWYLIGLHQMDMEFPSPMAVYTNIYRYRQWIVKIVQTSN